MGLSTAGDCSKALDLDAAEKEAEKLNEKVIKAFHPFHAAIET